MNPYIALRVEFRRLFDALHSGNFRQDLAEKACLVQEFKSSPSRPFREQLGKFIAYALRRNLLDFVRMPAYRVERGRFNRETKASGKAHCSQ